MILVVAAIFTIITIVYSRFINKFRGLPPGPPPLPFLGNLLSLRPRPVDKVFLAWRDEYGPVFTIWMPRPTVVIIGCKEVNEALVQQADAFAGRPPNSEVVFLTMDGPKGLVFNDNNQWKEQRRFAQRALRHLGMGSSAMQDMICKFAHEVVGLLREKKGETIRLRPYFMFVVANVIWSLTFGRTLSFDDPLLAKVDTHSDMLMELQGHSFMILIELLGHKWAGLVDWLTGGRVSEILEHNSTLMEVLENEVKRVEWFCDEEESSECFADAFIKQQRKLQHRCGDVGTFKRTQLLMAAGDLWFAGFEATVTTLRYGIHYLLNRSEIQTRMQAEIDANIGKREIRMEDLSSLPFCCAVVLELQRIVVLTSTAVPRHTLQEATVAGVRIPAGVDVLPQNSHMDKRVFEQPEYFAPERFLDDKGKFVKDPRVTPYSSGRRACLGEGLARMELFLILTTLVQHLSFRSPSVVPPRLETREGFIRSVKPFDVIVDKR